MEIRLVTSRSDSKGVVLREHRSWDAVMLCGHVGLSYSGSRDVPQKHRKL